MVYMPSPRKIQKAGKGGFSMSRIGILALSGLLLTACTNQQAIRSSAYEDINKSWRVLLLVKQIHITK